MAKNYYALYAPYGIQTLYNDCHWPTVHVFTSKKARDLWVWEDEILNREPVSASEAHKYRDPHQDVIHKES